jgi:ATP-dependent Lon protease
MAVALDAEADQKNTDSATDRILRWTRTGEYTFKTDYVESQTSGSTIGTGQIQDGSVEKASSALSAVKTSSNSSQSDLSEESVDLNPDPKPIELLVGCQDDTLIPSPD